LRAEGAEQLLSAFPKAGVLGWMSPWHGGLSPVLTAGGGFPGVLHTQRFEGRPSRSVDDRGLEWTGVRVSCTPEHEKLRGLRLEVDYLTLGGSPVLKVSVRVTNLESVVRRVSTGLMAYVQPGGSREKTIVSSEHGSHKTTPRNSQRHAGRWGIATNPASGTSIVLSSPSPDVGLFQAGPDGNHLMLFAYPHVPPESSYEVTGFIALTGTPETAKGWTALSGLA
ncbi:MAG TPA: hypothetical protein VNE62_06985, partial [Actinomycetota bacterium]|nr:hypothetical protein [Actinomycetota bacterium]